MGRGGKAGRRTGGFAVGSAPWTHLSQPQTPFSRFDLVCNAQHGTVDRPFEWWQTTFRDSIAAIGRVVLVLAPWSDPIPLTRVWCLFEIFSAAKTDGVTLAVRLPPTERPAFEEALAGSFNVVMDTLVRVQSERAEVRRGGRKGVPAD